MKNVKRILTWLVVLAMVLGCMFALAACKDDENPNPGPQPGPSGDIPTEEGKVTFYCTIPDYEMPSYGAAFLLGPYTQNEKGDWAPGVEMKNLEGTKIWYVIIDITPEELLANINDPTKDGGKWNNYMVDLGYSASIDPPASLIGETGLYLKSDETAAPGGMDNPTYEYTGGQLVNLGEQHFNINGGNFGEPVKVSGATVRITFSEALGENADVLIMGLDDSSWTEEGGRAHPATIDGKEDRSVWERNVKDVFANTYTFKVLVCEDKTKIDTAYVDANGNAPGVWDKVLVESENEGGNRVKAYIEIYDSTVDGGNISGALEFSNQYHDLAGTVSETFHTDDYDSVKKGIDINAKLEKTTANGIVSRKVDICEELTLTVKFASALDTTTYHVWFASELTGWDGSCELTSDDGITWTAKVKVAASLLGTSIEGKITITDTEEFDWTNEQKGDGPQSNGNALLTLPSEAGVWNLFGAEYTITFPAAPAE